MKNDYRIALIHYHLRPGGVTRVLERQVSILARGGARCTVLVGELEAEQATTLDGAVLVPGLGYTGDHPPGSATLLARRLKEASRRTLGAAPDVWHIHNHSLGKNPTLTAAVLQLAREGHRLLLQIHDFAEDSRPSAYRFLRECLERREGPPLGWQLYPQAPRVHYAVLNHRDRRFLEECGVPAGRLHRLPNAVVSGDNAGSSRSAGGQGVVAARPDERLYLYPTRAIRRKNLGELLLWASVARRDERFATTLVPLNPVERPRYESWVRLSGELDLPVDFGLGHGSGRSFEQLVASARYLVTTSVAEGFGMAFLEPWLHGRGLVGRDLPEITEDFVETGVDLSSLYSRLGFPLDWIDGRELRAKIEAKRRTSLAAYGREPDDDDVERAWREIVQAGRVDFGRLDEELQADVIRRLHAAPEQARDLSPSRLDPGELPEALIASNESAVRTGFSEEVYGESLRSAYDALLEEPAGPVEGIDEKALLKRFLAPERFFLLRT